LSVVFGGSVLGTFAETNTNSVVTGEVDDKEPLRFCRRGAATPRVSEIDDEAKPLKGRALEKTICPDLEPERLC